MDVQRHDPGIFRVLFIGPVRRAAQVGGPQPRFDGGEVALDGSPDTLLSEQPVFPAWVHETVLSPQTEAQAVSVVDFVPHVLHQQVEMPQVVGAVNGSAQIRLQHGAEGGLALGLAQPLNVADRLGGLALHDHGQPVLPAQPVRYRPDLAVVALGVAVVLLARVSVDRVKNEMGVDVLLVHMDGDYRLVSGQMLLGKLLGNLQRQFRGDLAGLEGLDHMVVLHPVCFPIGPLGIQHLAALPARVAVQVRGEGVPLGLVPVEDVLDAQVQPGVSG